VKDIIIRGGENVSAAEVEQLLAHMEGVAEVAVVAAPDERLGEHGCAFFRMQAGFGAPDLAAVRAHLGAAGLARQKWPEELRSVDELPRTPSGKVQKFVLRDQLRSGG
jgi:non-ribosomal peptide synthetase component E (peptide arylation enzyme)